MNRVTESSATKYLSKKFSEALCPLAVPENETQCSHVRRITFKAGGMF